MSSGLLKVQTWGKCCWRWGNSVKLLAKLSRLEPGPKNWIESRNLRSPVERIHTTPCCSVGPECSYIGSLPCCSCWVSSRSGDVSHARWNVHHNDVDYEKKKTGICLSCFLFMLQLAWAAPLYSPVAWLWSRTLRTLNFFSASSGVPSAGSIS